MYECKFPANVAASSELTVREPTETTFKLPQLARIEYYTGYFCSDKDFWLRFIILKGFAAFNGKPLRAIRARRRTSFIWKKDH